MVCLLKLLLLLLFYSINPTVTHLFYEVAQFSVETFLTENFLINFVSLFISVNFSDVEKSSTGVLINSVSFKIQIRTGRVF